MPNETLDATIDAARAFANRWPPGRATSMISITTITVLENDPAVGAADPGQGPHLRVLGLEPSSSTEHAAEPATHGPERLLRTEAGPADQRHRGDGRDPGHQPDLDGPGLQV